MSTDPTQSVFILPDILAQWPWRRNINPLSGLQAETESTAWILSFFDAFTPRLQQALEHCNTRFYSLDLLSSLAYPKEDKGINVLALILIEKRNTSLSVDVFRVACDLMNWFLLFDENTDAATPQEAQHMATIVMDAVRNSDKARPAGECFIGEAARQ
ncbi:hypothetical protein C0992_010543 [Termitomyces sp. T32_za158]|nr:hypothetical protein C0992_010543 [Termitomyces sp. T32_za158]